MENDPLALPQPDARQTLRLTIAVIVLTIAGSLSYGWWRWHRWHEDWNRLGPLEPNGGLYFPSRVELKVPLFRQADERWRHDKLAKTEATLGAEGCAVAAAAMVLASYGADTDPGRLNKLVTEADGYVGNGWLVWEKAAEVTGDIARKAYEGEPSFRLIDENLRQLNPVIVRLRTEGGITHFAVIAGKEGYDYLTRDPGAGAAKGLYPLREFGSKIEALRFYERLK
jgi:hypothetical protein